MSAGYQRAYVKKLFRTQRAGVWRIAFSDNGHECSFITSLNRIDFFQSSLSLHGFSYVLRAKGHAASVSANY